MRTPTIFISTEHAQVRRALEAVLQSEIGDLGRSPEKAADLVLLLFANGSAQPEESPVRDTARSILLATTTAFGDRTLKALQTAIDEHFAQGSLTGSGAAAAGPLIGGDRLVGDTLVMKQLRDSIRRISNTDSNVLITGETGTGKELVAELIQANSERRSKPFICINCAAIPDSLLESELFGYERGAFTGAHAARPGKLELADGGTVFFDEIGDMSPYAQAKILRAIEGKEVQRLGGKRSTRVDVRIIAATNRELESAEGERTFRRDLYFRLNVANLHLVPLRERKPDIPLLIRHYIGELNQRFARKVEGLAPEALPELLQHHWPGNVRELKNVLESMFVNLASGPVQWMHLPEALRRRILGMGTLAPSEQELLLNALWSTGWNKSKVARQLQWSRMTVYRKMAKYNLSSEPEPAK